MAFNLALPMALWSRHVRQKLVPITYTESGLSLLHAKWHKWQPHFWPG